MNRIRQIGAAALGLTLLAASAPAMAGKIVCWTDDDGNRACGDRVPPKAARKERTIMDDEGRAREVRARERTAEEVRAERAARELNEELKRRQDEQRRYDQYLVQTFGSVAEIEQARENRLAMIDGRLRLLEKASADSETSLAQLQEQAQPHLDNERPVPEKLAEQIRSFTQAVADNQAAMRSLKEERLSLNEQFDEDIRRYQTLTSVNP